MGFFPVDDVTPAIPAANRNGRQRERRLVERYCKRNKVCSASTTARKLNYTKTLSLDHPSTGRPQPRGARNDARPIALSAMKHEFQQIVDRPGRSNPVSDCPRRFDRVAQSPPDKRTQQRDQRTAPVVIAAIHLPCTNTSQPVRP